MIDALGFKGIWKRQDVEGRPDAVIEKLVGLRDEVNRFLDLQCGGADARIRLAGNRSTAFDLVHASFLSDTIVLAVAIKDLEQTVFNDTKLPKCAYEFGASGIAVHLACQFASAITAMGARTNPALAYRGCISFGEFEVRDNFLVGPAVDEAAAASDLAQGAFVWLLPSALDAFMSTAEEIRSNRANASNYLEWEVPLKGGDSFVTYAVSPFALATTEAEVEETHSRIFETFTGNLDIQIKKQRTFQFLDACAEEWKARRAQEANGKDATQ
jgi:hypothetical protein